MALLDVKDLMERRVPQYTAAYLGASWVAIEFFAFLEDRFLLSPHLTNLVLAMLVLLLPSVVLFTYFHGRKGPDRWSPTEKVFIPLNMLFAVIVLFVAFAGKELGAVTRTVTVANEEGETVERVVPRSEFRKRVALFPLDTDTSDPNTAWLGKAVSTALTVDLYQDMFLDLREWEAFQEDLRAVGNTTGQGLSAPLKRRLAQDAHLGYYVDGEARRSADGFGITVRLNDVERGQVVSEQGYTGTDLFDLVDSASVQLRRDMEVPARQIEENRDVPVSEILTSSEDALRSFVEGMSAVAQSHYAAGDRGLAAATVADPTFALAHFVRFAIQVLLGEPDAAVESIQKAMEYRYRLAERYQYQVKGEWYGMQQDFAKMYAVYEMWAELYPQDIQAQRAAAQVRIYQDDRAGAIEKLEQILALDPTQLELLQLIGSLYQDLGDLERARTYFQRYADANPEDKDSFTALAGLNRNLGDHAAARELYQRALLLEPTDVEVMASLASLDRDLGNFEAAEDGFTRALEAARTPPQRFEALKGLNRLHAYRGSYTTALEYLEQSMPEFDMTQPPIARIQFRLMNLGTYVRAGQPDRALLMLDSMVAEIPEQLGTLVPLGQIRVYEALGRVDDLDAAVQRGQAMLERTDLNFVAQPVVWGEGRLHELRDEWQAAIAAYERERELNPSDPEIPTQLGRCYRELGDLERAESLILETLAARPSYAPAHLELAKVYEAMGRLEEATSHLERALDTWAPADPGYGPAEEAREMLQRLAG